MERRKSRAHALRRKRRGGGGEEPGGTAGAAADLQARLEAAWAALEMPMMKKLQFLQKFSEGARSAELPRAVELHERAAVAVPLRETCLRRLAGLRKTNRVGLAQLVKELDVGGRLAEIGCAAPLPDSFHFELKVELGDLTDEDLLVVGETFEERVAGGELQWARDMKRWLEEVRDRLDDYCLELGKDMGREVDERLLWKGIVYHVKKEAPATAAAGVINKEGA